MLELMKESEGKIVGFRATGKLSRKDYDGPEDLARQFGRVRALVYMDDGFKGWDLPAAWANTKLDMRHRGDLEKVGLLMKGERRTFPTNQFPEAWNWLGS